MDILVCLIKKGSILTIGIADSKRVLSRLISVAEILSILSAIILTIAAVIVIRSSREIYLSSWPG